MGKGVVTDRMSVADSVAEQDETPTDTFRCLVERSIASWHSLSYVGTERTDSTARFIKILQDINSMEDLLKGGRFWFFQLRESFLSAKRMIKWDPLRMDQYILLPIDYGFVNNQDCFFVSHYWHTPVHPDPHGDDIRLFQQDLEPLEWSYVWVDWTCMPQAPRTDVQRIYFKKILRCIPMLARDCAFAWRFGTFEPRAWILFELAEVLLTHVSFTLTDDIAEFVAHIKEMVQCGVRPVISKYGYTCTNGASLARLTGLLEFYLILVKLVPDIGARQALFDRINRDPDGKISIAALDLEIDMVGGIIACNRATYKFTPDGTHEDDV